MLNTDEDEQWLLGIAAQVEVLLVVIGPSGVANVRLWGLLIPVFAEVTVHELAVTEVEVHLQPLLRKGYGPEAVGSQMNLGYGLGVGAFDKRPGREQIVAHHLALFTTARLDEERLVAEVDVALL